jgi:lipoate-protein ligase A
LRSLDEAHRFVLGTIATHLQQAIQPAPASPPALRHDSPPTAHRLPPAIIHAGISDLVFGDRKFSGNSLRCKRRFLLYHGTLLYRFPLEQIGKLLKMPSRQPDYRAGRSHDHFLVNLPLDAATLRRALIQAFGANEHCDNWPRELTAQLVAEKYTLPEWNQRM